MNKVARGTKKVVIVFVGWAVLLAGIVMIPFPGPGWAVVFIGFAILATEFDWAKDIQAIVKEKYVLWRAWFDVQPMYIKAVFTFLTFLTASIIVWLVNGYGFAVEFFHIDAPWLVSPFFR